MSAAPLRALSQIRRDIHAHPELGFRETRTAALIVQELEAAGVDEIHSAIGQTGIVAVVRKGNSGRSVGIRADMDALPMSETGTARFRSQFEGVMHACGHDGHVAILLGTARELVARTSFDGTVHLIFQPAEEGMGGAAAMIGDGLFSRFQIDQVFALHNWPGLPVANAAIKAGAMMASVDRFDIVLTGKGGHAAQPHLTHDPLPGAAQIVTALQTLISRERDPTEPAVLSITQVSAGSAYNVIPETATIRGTVRTTSEHTRGDIAERLRSVAEAIAGAFKLTVAVQYFRGTCATLNHGAETELLRAAAIDALGAEKVIDLDHPSLAGEDFGLMLEHCPGAFIRLGNGADSASLHSPNYDFCDDAIEPGVRLWTSLVMRALPTA